MRVLRVTSQRSNEDHLTIYVRRRIHEMPGKIFMCAEGEKANCESCLIRLHTFVYAFSSNVRDSSSKLVHQGEQTHPLPGSIRELSICKHIEVQK